MKRVLVIEDRDDLRAVFAATLVVGGYSVRGARDGREGIVMVLAEHPDLILCDINMPGMDGYRTLEAIRKCPGTADIPFIMMTGSTVHSEFRRAMNCGADDYLAKPFAPSQLLAAVKTRLERHAGPQREVAQRDSQPAEAETWFCLHESAMPVTHAA